MTAYTYKGDHIYWKIAIELESLVIVNMHIFLRMWKEIKTYFRSEMSDKQNQKDVNVYFISITSTPMEDRQTLLEHTMIPSLSGWENMHFACGFDGSGLCLAITFLFGRTSKGKWREKFYCKMGEPGKPLALVFFSYHIRRLGCKVTGLGLSLTGWRMVGRGRGQHVLQQPIVSRYYVT